MKEITTYLSLPKKIIEIKYLIRLSHVTLEARGTALHITICTLNNSNEIAFKRQREAHTHQNGGLAHFSRYTLGEPYRVNAEQLVAHYGGKQNEEA